MLPDVGLHRRFSFILIVSDSSFISLNIALVITLTFAAPGAHAMLLIKSQFEGGYNAISA